MYLFILQFFFVGSIDVRHLLWWEIDEKKKNSKFVILNEKEKKTNERMPDGTSFSGKIGKK